MSALTGRCMRAFRAPLQVGLGSARTGTTGVRSAPQSLTSWVQPARLCSTTACSSNEHLTVPGSEGPKVVIVGGGFGGLYTAVKLSGMFWPKGKQPQVTLVDQHANFVFKPLLYELLNGTASRDEVAPSFEQLLAPYPVRFIQSKAVGVEPGAALRDGSSIEGGVVQLEGGGALEYDWLVMALGSQADPRGVPGVREYAVPFNTLDDAMRVQECLFAIEAGHGGANGQPPTVMVVGAGYAGVELAAVIAERLKGRAQVQLVTPGSQILDNSPLGLREAASQTLAALGVQVMTETRVLGLSQPADAAPGALPTAVVADLSSSSTSGSSSPSGEAQGEASASGAASAPASHQQHADLVLWTAGSSPALQGAREGLPFPTTERGSVQTEATLRVQGQSRVFALGDISCSTAGYASSGSSTAETAFPATAQVAQQQADYVAWNLWAAMNNRPLLPFRYRHLGNMMSLGQLNASVALPVPVPLPLQSTVQDSPLGPLLQAAGVKLSTVDPQSGVTLKGPLAALVRRAAYLLRQPTAEQRLNVATRWLQQAGSVAARKVAGVAAGQGPKQ